MIKYFNKDLVLTSEVPEGFLNFVYESSDTSTWFIIPRVDTSLAADTIYINGLDINGGIDPSVLNYETSLGFALVLDFDGDPSIASMIVSSGKIEDFNYNLIIDVYDNSTLITPFESLEVSIFNRHNIIDTNSFNVFETTNIQTDGDTSYLLMRANPKFSGNIKLVMDSSNRIYLDTFKASDILSSKKYRKQIVSGNSVLSSDIRRVFQDMPLGELYRLDNENTLDIKLPKTELYDQYELNYSYGARLFKDELYSEDYAMLAPIWLNKEIPSYFAVFRVDGPYNEETYDSILDSDFPDFADKYISDGNLVSTWSLKEASPIGTYMRNHVEELLQFRAPVFLSLTDPNQIDFDPNTWYGMAVDKGIITGRSEVPYFFNQKAGNFTDMNAFISEGFERNNLLLPNLINTEFVFSDEDVSLYSMSRYFGLYLTENELYRIAYYADVSGGAVSIISLDDKDSSSFFNSDIFDSSTGDVTTKYSNRIFGLDDVLSFNRISNSSQADGSNYDEISEWVNKPGANLFAAEIEEKSFDDFISFKINNLLNPGEHLRIISESEFKIWEVYGSNWDILEAGESLTFANTYESDGYPVIYRCIFSTKGDIKDQILAIQKAFNVFGDYEGTPFRTGIRKSDSLSLIINDGFDAGDYNFQRITANTTTLHVCDGSDNFNGASTSGDISFYGRLTPSDDDMEIISCDSSFGPINFELYGGRKSITLNIFEPSSHYIYSMDASYGDMFSDNMLYLSEDDQWYRLINEIDISTNNTNKYTYSYVEDPLDLSDKIIIITEHPIELLNDKYWNAYDVYPLSISLMGINPVKDIDYTVYDSTLGYESEYWYSREDDSEAYEFALLAEASIAIDARGSYEVIFGDGSISIGTDISTYSAGFKFNSFFGDVSIIATSDTQISYNVLDGSGNYSSYIEGSSEEDINDYYVDPSIKDFLKYGLSVPTVSKWVGLGSDCRGNPLRLILNGEILESSTNFIPFEENFNDELSYPVFKYLDSGERAWENYVYNDINDVISFIDDGSTSYSTIKNFMFDNPNVDIFSKLLYSNKNVSGSYLRSSIIYYNQYKDTIEGIINGLNISFKLSSSAKNILNIKNWDRYRFSFMSSPSRNSNSNSPIEVIINENTETLLVIWYQGNDLLNYTYRNSSTLGGKGLLSNDTSTLIWEGFEEGNPNYSFTKAPFFVLTSNISPSIENIYGTSVTGYSTGICTPFAQLNVNLASKINSIFNAFGGNFVNISNVFIFDSQYNTFNQNIDYDYTNSSITIGSTIINKTYKYLSNENIYSEQTNDLETFKFIIDKNNIEYYVIREDNIFTNENFSVRPLSISLISPKEFVASDSSVGIYTYLGWYTPNFNDILQFNANEDSDLIEIVDKDFTLGNTYLNGYNNIQQLWYNKVVETVTLEDIDTANAIDLLDGFNIFKAQWDADYYTLSSSSGDSLVDGFNSPLELPSFFGSKLIKLPAKLELDIWDVTSANSEDGLNWNTLKFNLTQNIINKFKNNLDFLDNWVGLTNSDNIIDEYIKKTIIGYYNITRPKIGVNIYTKIYDGQRLYYEIDDSFVLSDTKNVKGSLNFKNGDYIYNMEVDILPELSYYISFTLTEK